MTCSREFLYSGTRSENFFHLCWGHRGSSLCCFTQETEFERIKQEVYQEWRNGCIGLHFICYLSETNKLPSKLPVTEDNWSNLSSLTRRCSPGPSGTVLWSCTLMSCPVESWRPSSTRGAACPHPTAPSWSGSCKIFR